MLGRLPALPSICAVRRLATAGQHHETQLTSVRYPHVKRRADLSMLTDGDLAHFERLVGADNVLTTDLDGYNTDWLGILKGVVID